MKVQSPNHGTTRKFPKGTTRKFPKVDFLNNDSDAGFLLEKTLMKFTAHP